MTEIEPTALWFVILIGVFVIATFYYDRKGKR